MSAISGTRRSMKELADGTIRVQIDIDPMHRDEFFKMFGQIDMPVAIAPLVADFEQPKEEKPKGRELSRLAGIWCKEPKFWVWLDSGIYSEESAAEAVRRICEVDSRSEIDDDAHASEMFHKYVRLPYSEWLRTHG